MAKGGVSVFTIPKTIECVHYPAQKAMHAIWLSLSTPDFRAAIERGLNECGRLGALTWIVDLTRDPGVPSHPAVGYELLWDLAAAGVVVWALRRGLPAGVPFWLGLLLYGLGRYWVGFYRIDQQYALGLGLAQWLGLLVVPAAASWWLRSAH